MPILGHERGEDAFAQAPVGHAQSLAGPDPEQGLEDGTAGQHEIGPFVTDARLRHAVGIAHGDQVAETARTSVAPSQQPSTRERS